MYGEARSLAVGDMNNDARPDLVVSQHSAPAHMYLSTSEKAGLQVWLNGSPNNLSGIGASVRVEYFDGTLGARAFAVCQPAESAESDHGPGQRTGSHPCRMARWRSEPTRHCSGQRRLSVSPNE